MVLAYEGTVRRKNGDVLDRQVAETAEEAARLLFNRNPTTHHVQICDAFEDPFTGELRANGFNIRWMHRRDFERNSDFW